MNALLIIAKEGFQDKELAGARDGLVAGGFDVVLASTEAGACTGKYGSTEQASLALKDVDIGDYSRIAFIGGPGAGALAEDPDALRIANEASRANMPLGAICVAPTILAKAHVLEGKNATVFDNGGGNQALLEKYGANVTGDDVTLDGLILTGSGPDAAEEFGKTLARL